MSNYTLNLEIELPEGLTDDEIKEHLQTLADDFEFLHRNLGGRGLVVTAVNIQEQNDDS